MQSMLQIPLLSDHNMVPTSTMMTTMPTHIMMATYNVVSAHGPKLLMALQAMADINTNIALHMEMKLCDEQYAKRGHGYTLFATQASSTTQGSLALVWQTATTHWTLEGMRAVMVNVISMMLVSGMHHWLVIGAYLPPSVRPDIELMAIEVEYWHSPWLPVIWLGNFNANLEDEMCEQAITIATMAQHLGVVDLLHQFKQQKY